MSTINLTPTGGADTVDKLAIINAVHDASPGDTIHLAEGAKTGLTGTLSFTGDSKAVTGAGTAFTTELSAGDYIRLNVGSTADLMPRSGIVDTVTDNTNLVLKHIYLGHTDSGAASITTPWMLDGLDKVVSFAGNLTFTNGSKAVSSNTAGDFTNEAAGTKIFAGEYIKLDADGTYVRVASVTDGQNLMLANDYAGTGGTGAGTLDHTFDVQGGASSLTETYLTSAFAGGYHWFTGEVFPSVQTLRQINVDKYLIFTGDVDANLYPTTVVGETATYTYWPKSPHSDAYTAFWVHRGNGPITAPRFQNLEFDQTIISPLGFHCPHELNNVNLASVVMSVGSLSDNRSVYSDPANFIGETKTKLENVSLENGLTPYNFLSQIDYANHSAVEYTDMKIRSRGANSWNDPGFILSEDLLAGVAPGFPSIPHSFSEAGDVRDLTMTGLIATNKDAAPEFWVGYTPINFILQLDGIGMQDLEIKDCVYDWAKGNPNTLAVFRDPSAPNGVLRDVRIHDNIFKNLISGFTGDFGQGIFMGRVEDSFVSKNKFENYAATAGNAIFMNRCVNCVVINNDYVDCNLPSFEESDNFRLGPVFINRCTDCTVFESGNFPVGQGGAAKNVYNRLGDTNNIIGQPANLLVSNPGIGHIVDGIADNLGEIKRNPPQREVP